MIRSHCPRADVVPLGEYVEIAEAGHFGFLERPGEVNQVMIQFLSASGIPSRGDGVVGAAGRG